MRVSLLMVFLVVIAQTRADAQITEKTIQVGDIFQAFKASPAVFQEKIANFGLKDQDVLNNFRGEMLIQLTKMNDLRLDEDDKITANTLRNFQAHAKLWDYANNPDVDKALMVEICNNVVEDSRIKREYFAKGGKGDVAVIAHTKDPKTGKEKGGYQVWYIPYALDGDPDLENKFDQDSSPTPPQSMSPGRYKMWTQLKDKPGKKVPVIVGLDGKAEKNVDLPIPD